MYRCMLHNFAGNIEMYGVLDAIASGPIDARTSNENSTMASLFFSLILRFALNYPFFSSLSSSIGLQLLEYDNIVSLSPNSVSI